MGAGIPGPAAIILVLAVGLGAGEHFSGLFADLPPLAGQGGQPALRHAGQLHARRRGPAGRHPGGRGHDLPGQLGRGHQRVPARLARGLLHAHAPVVAQELHDRHDHLRRIAGHVDRGDADQQIPETALAHARRGLRGHQRRPDRDHQRGQRLGQHHAHHGRKPAAHRRPGRLPAGARHRQGGDRGQQHQAQGAGREHAAQEEHAHEQHQIDEQHRQRMQDGRLLQDLLEHGRHHRLHAPALGRVRAHREDPRGQEAHDPLARDHHAHADRGQRPGEHRHRERLDRLRRAGLHGRMHRAHRAYEHVHEPHHPADPVRGRDRHVPLRVRHGSGGRRERAHHHALQRLAHRVQHPREQLLQHRLDDIAHDSLPTTEKQQRKERARPDGGTGPEEKGTGPEVRTGPAWTRT